MSTLGLVLVVIVILALIGGLGGERWGVPYGYGVGNYGIGGVGVILVAIVLLWALGYLR